MRQFPVFFNTDDADIVVFGGGEEARRKVRLLAKTTARITVVIGREIDDGFAQEFAGRITIAPQTQAGQALDRAKFAIIACRLDDNTEKAMTWARQYGVPLNVVDQPHLCDFTVPSMLERGDLIAAVGSGGAAPVLAKSVRTKLETLMPQGARELTALAKSMRPDVSAALSEGSDRRRYWEQVLNGKAADLAYAGDIHGAEAEMRRALAKFGASEGVIHIVGAGPGDPELLTLKAFRLIQNADVVYYDRLVSDDIMDLVRRDADRISVGKSKGDHSVPQPDIHKLMIASAREGKRVVRLKGGDPFIFGRGGEELEAVRAAGIEAHVVPGISSALGCAASAGIPLTHRDHAQTLTFVTGHAKAGPGGDKVPDLDWPSLAKAQQTVVVFMGVGTSGAISDRLIAAGRAPDTPVAVIENGTRANEIREFGKLSDLASMIERSGIKGPALLVIGEVVSVAAPKQTGKLTSAAEALDTIIEAFA